MTLVTRCIKTKQSDVIDVGIIIVGMNANYSLIDIYDNDHVLPYDTIICVYSYTFPYSVLSVRRCNKLVDGQNFEPGIVHLRIENAGEIRLGPNALRVRGLQQLESITIADTRIVEIDRTAFNGVTYLLAVNLTRNNLQDIHPNTFQNNTRLSLLTISDNPLKHTQDAKSPKHYLLHAPSVADFDFSNNGLLRLKRTAFAKMHGLNYINLRGNRLREIDRALFDSLDSLEEIDLSDNFLDDLPTDIFDDKGVQVLRISGKNDDHVLKSNLNKKKVITLMRCKKE